MARFLGVFLACLPVWAQQVTHSEYEVKAAFLYNFAKFVEWPEDSFGSPESPLSIGILGSDPFKAVLDDVVKGKEVNGRRIEIVRSNDAAQLDACQMVFISSSEKGRLPQVLEGLNGHSILTVADMEGFTERGGMVGLMRRRNRVCFDVNIAAAKRAHLQVSSQLLKLADSVKGREQAKSKDRGR